MNNTLILHSFARNVTKGMKLINHSIYDFLFLQQPQNGRSYLESYTEQENAEAKISEQLQNCLMELAELKRALSTSQQQLKAAQQQIKSLTRANACFRQKLIRLAKKCAKARYSAYHDELTGLVNRSLLLDRLKQALAQSDRQHKQVALLFIDLDKFKSVNDRLGHAAGDLLLQQVAERISDCIRFGDTACRYGGDEFVVMLPEIHGQESVASVTEKIRARLDAPYVLDGNVIKVTASIGTAIYCNSGQDSNDLIKQADAAMYLAKAHNNLQNRFFQPGMMN